MTCCRQIQDLMSSLLVDRLHLEPYFQIGVVRKSCLLFFRDDSSSTVLQSSAARRQSATYLSVMAMMLTLIYLVECVVVVSSVTLQVVMWMR